MASKTKILKYWQDNKVDVEKNVCFECGVNTEYLERAHIVARCIGGLDTEDNLVLVCHQCHALTDGRTKEQWEDKLMNGNSSITINGIYFPGDFILRAIDIYLWNMKNKEK